VQVYKTLSIVSGSLLLDGLRYSKCCAQAVGSAGDTYQGVTIFEADPSHHPTVIFDFLRITPRQQHLSTAVVYSLVTIYPLSMIQ